MSFGRSRRTSSRRQRLPLRITSYRSSPLPEAVSSTPDQPDRATVLAQLKYSAKRTVIHSPVHVPAIVTADSLFLTLPIPPSINHQYATVNGRRLLSSAGRAYKTHVSQQVWMTLTGSSLRGDLLRRMQAGRLALSIRFFFTSALRRDVDGGLKIAQDALCEGLGLNDNRIIETHLYKDLDKTNPRMEVSLSLALRSPS